MDHLSLQNIYVYPIKSLAGIAVAESKVTDTGLQYDRRWMLTDNEGNFLSQRSHPQMAMLSVNFTEAGLTVHHRKTVSNHITIPFDATPTRELKVTIWDDICTALELDKGLAAWFSRSLGLTTRLVYMPGTTRRLVDHPDAVKTNFVSFADAYPFMMIGQSSLDDLNSRLAEQVLMNRFRPNFVFNGGEAFCEDRMKAFQINDVVFEAAKPCSRCNLITINQEDGSKSKEPSQTLATYRSHQNKILFGQNLLHRNNGIIKVGDKIKIISTSY